MKEATTAFLAWLGPILSALITSGGLAIINAKLASGERKRDEARAETEAKRKAEAEWRDRMEQRIGEIEDKVDTTLTAQCSQMRSDIVHKCHRYLDDVGKASTEEKKALKAEHVEYSAVCEANGIENEFIDLMVQRVMELPERDM
jgi:uncharacterized membrane protein YqiK